MWERFRNARRKGRLALRYLPIGLLVLLGTCVLPAQQQQPSGPPPVGQTTRGGEPVAGPMRAGSDKLLANRAPQTASQGQTVSQGTTERISFHDKFSLYWHQAVNPAGVALPLVTAGYRMANPLQGYPG